VEVDPGLAWRAEQACFNAWPALNDVLVGDWICRRAPGVSRRSNSANPLRIDPQASPAAVEACEVVYRRWRAPAYFRVPSLIGPAIDRELDRRGYAWEGDTPTLWADLEDVEAVPDKAVEVRSHAGEDWLDARCAMMAFDAGQQATYRAAIARLSLPAGFAALMQDGRPVCVGYGVVDHGVLCLESVVTDPGLRGRGLARRMVAALFGWARANGASAACLQVEADNTPAVALYRSLGFGPEIYRYHYRRSPAPVS
jgi:ribosomal protein S18 acetylase RimI-like enzyme